MYEIIYVNFVYVNLPLSQHVLKTFLVLLIFRVNLDTQSRIESVHYTAGLFIAIFTSDVIEVLCLSMGQVSVN